MDEQVEVNASTRGGGAVVVYENSRERERGGRSRREVGDDGRASGQVVVGGVRPIYQLGLTGLSERETLTLTHATSIPWSTPLTTHHSPQQKEKATTEKGEGGGPTPLCSTSTSTLTCFPLDSTSTMAPPPCKLQKSCSGRAVWLSGCLCLSFFFLVAVFPCQSAAFTKLSLIQSSVRSAKTVDRPPSEQRCD